MIKLVHAWLLPKDKRPLALPMRCLGAEPGDYTWEDWEEEMQRDYPVRFRFSLALHRLHGLVCRWPRISRAAYWLRTHTYNRYHILNLTHAEPENPDGYRWGWIDRNHLIMLAAFKVLRDFVEEEKPWDCGKELVKVEADPERTWEAETLRQQKAAYDEIMALYRWWTAGRLTERKAHDDVVEAARLRYEQDKSDEDSRKQWCFGDEKWQEREDEMLRRLIAVRHHLWT